MNTAFCHSIAFAFLLLWQAAACGLLLLWLWRHRSVKVPFYRGARLEATEAASMHHPRAKPEWVVSGQLTTPLAPVCDTWLETALLGRWRAPVAALRPAA